MAVFDLERFRSLAFGRKATPDHPMGSLAEARKLIELLPVDDPDHALAEVAHWAATMNATESFSPGRRARVLMELDAAARPIWQQQTRRYLAPQGKPQEGRDGDPRLLRALYDCASEFANGFGRALDEGRKDSGWLAKHRTHVMLRNMRWLVRRVALSHMLQLSSGGATWERLHRLYRIAEAEKISREVIQIFPADKATSSIRQEYAQAILVELAAPESLRGREVELVFRIARRVVASVQVEPERFPEACFAIVPAGDARPVLASKLGAGAVPAPLYIGTANCLPRLRGALERDLGRDPGEADTLYGQEFTLRERSAMLDRVLEHWGPNPPRRRARRVEMATPVRIVCGFDRVLAVAPAVAKKPVADPDKARRELQLQIDSTTSGLKRAQLGAAREAPARLVDASAGGVGIAIRRADARWAGLGALLAILIEPGKKWFVGVIRRVFSVEDELRLGVQLLSALPTTVTLRLEALSREHVWEDAMKHEESFGEQFKKGILLEPQSLPLQAAELLLPAGLASRGSQFNVPLGKGEQRIRITRLLEDGEHYQRALFEPLPS